MCTTEDITAWMIRPDGQSIETPQYSIRLASTVLCKVKLKVPRSCSATQGVPSHRGGGYVCGRTPERESFLEMTPFGPFLTGKSRTTTSTSKWYGTSIWEYPIRS